MAREIFPTAKPSTRARSREAIADIARSDCDAALFAKDAFDEGVRVEVIAGRRSDADRCTRTLSRDFWQQKNFSRSAA